MPPRRLVLPVATALVVVSAAIVPGRAPAVSAASSIGFEVPSVVDPIQLNGEPDIAVDPQGRVFSSGPTGTGTQRSVWYGSVDGGHTYRAISPGPPPSPAQTFKDPPGGGDTDINFDHTSKQYFADLYALACVRTATTSNGGATVNESVTGGCSNGLEPGADRQWLAVFDPKPGISRSPYTGPLPLIYLEYNNLVGPGPNGGAQWNKSNSAVDPLPGGPGLNYVNALASSPPGTGGVYTPFGPDGYPAIDQVTGKIFQAAGFKDSTGTWSLRLNIGSPDAMGNLTFLDAPTATNPQGDPSQLITIANNLPDSPDTLFSVLSMDSARNLVVAWALSDASSTNPLQRQVYVSASSAATGWRTWTTPVPVSDGSTTTGDAVNVFPWIKAGSPGHADAVWYGSNLAVDPSSHNQQAWNVFLNQVVFPTDSTGAITGAAPAKTLARVSPHPNHYDDICLQGTNCVLSTGNRNLADFFEVNIDRSGAAEVVYDDTSNGLIQNPIPTSIPQVADHAGAPVVTVARQSSGPGLFTGTAVSGPTNAPVSGLNDPAGDALYPVIGGTDQPGMDIRNSRMHLSADGHTLTVTMQVIDLAHPASTLGVLASATNLQYVTRWQMGNTIYYAAMETGLAGQPSFYAGKAQSIDLCSVSACFPHVITYPEPGAGPTFTGIAEPGQVSCPAEPSATNPCSLSIAVRVQDVGNPNASSLLEEVGGYSLAASVQEGNENNVNSEGDVAVPLQVDGVCCYNFQASVANGGPPVCHEADGDGDVSDGRGGKAHVHVDQDRCEDGGSEGVQESDASTGDSFQSTQVNAVSFNDALQSMTVLGSGTHNGQTVTFSLVAVNGGAGVGAFTLTLSDGYAISGNLLDGAVQLQ